MPVGKYAGTKHDFRGVGLGDRFKNALAGLIERFDPFEAPKKPA